jgi:hypothetical protein
VGAEPMYNVQKKRKKNLAQKKRKKHKEWRVTNLVLPKKNLAEYNNRRGGFQEY